MQLEDRVARQRSWPHERPSTRAFAVRTRALARHVASGIKARRCRECGRLDLTIGELVLAFQEFRRGGICAADLTMNMNRTLENLLKRATCTIPMNCSLMGRRKPEPGG